MLAYEKRNQIKGKTTAEEKRNNLLTNSLNCGTRGIAVDGMSSHHLRLNSEHSP